MKILSVLIATFLTGNLFAQSTPEQIRAVDSIFSRYKSPETTGISVMVIRDGRKLYSRSFGYADIARKVRATSKTNYRIASVTKPFTAMAILMLRDQGKLDLGDRLDAFFPDLPAFSKEITVKQMINHTSGLKSYGSVPTSRPLKDINVLHIVAEQDSTNFKPGTKFSYSNTAYVLLGLIVEKVSGLPFDEFVRRHIFKPLKMANSTFNNMEGTIPNRAYGYNPKDGKLVLDDQSTASYLQGDGGIYSSIDDFYYWDQALYGDKLVKRETLNEIFSPSSNETPEIAYGYGWYIERRYNATRISHSGGTTGFSSYYVRYPEKKFSIVVFGNQDDGLALDPIITAIERIYLR
ncbi:serine hydrolase domain-containing protein [Pedobacter deserti]|uniref:serine hydrolase domain-containing protein n=1 Tax=Pedobacter deserti TaxID=2817382 RepID=UPI00210C4746|nr:serine hydrolase domain-containing protein [Pedobacter sp. SYSU D00382]